MLNHRELKGWLDRAHIAREIADEVFMRLYVEVDEDEIQRWIKPKDDREPG